MMNKSTESFESSIADPDLVAASLRGDRDGFGIIVARYQSLVCALTYSATGDLALSEDLAQETFVTAWKRLRDLREPEKLRPWLCGIARNLANNVRRRRTRGPLEEVAEFGKEEVSPEPTPAQETIAREEATLLWESLEKISETYREPMVLYYREQKSVKQVAELLDLSEETARQRLSRGRKLLHAHVLDLVASVLERSTPGRALTIGILAALPFYGATSTATAATLTAAGGSGLKAAGLVGIATAILGPLVGILGGVIGVKASLAQAESERERSFILRSAGFSVTFILLFVVGMIALVLFGIPHSGERPVFLVWMVIVFSLLYIVGLLAMIFFFNWKQKRIRAEEGPPVEVAGRKKTIFVPVDYCSRVGFLGLPLLRVRLGRRPLGDKAPAVGWIAIGDRAFGGFFAFGGLAVAPISFGGFSLGILSLGGLAGGVATWGGMTLGLWATGGLAIGYLVFGGVALGWEGAMGGIAVARHYAIGGVAHAKHANDAVAAAMIENAEFFAIAVRVMEWGWMLVFVPLVLVGGLFLYAARKSLRRGY